MSVTVSPGVGMSSRGRRGRTPGGRYGLGQRLTALERANEIRLARAALRRRLARGEVSAAEVILECPECASSWPVGDVLAAQWRWGPTRMRKFLARSHIMETKPLGTLTARQRGLLATMLDEPVMEVATDPRALPEPVAPPLSPAEVQAVVDYLTVPL